MTARETVTWGALGLSLVALMFGFSVYAVDSWKTGVEGEVAKVEGKVEKIETRATDTELRVTKIEAVASSTERRLGSIEGKLDRVLEKAK